MDYSGSMVLKNEDAQKRAIIDLSYAPSLAAIETFAATCHNMTAAKIARASWIQSKTFETFPANPGDIYDLEYAAHFKFRRSNPTNGIYFRNFRLPSPRLAIFELIQDTGYRITKSYGDAMAIALSILWEETVTFDSGWLVH